MATLTAGHVYLIESDAGDNQNWVTDPENIVIGNFTEGTDYCKFKIPTQYVKVGSTGIRMDIASSGVGYMERTYRRGYIVDFITNEEVGDVDLIDKFIMGDRHTASSSSTYTTYYLVIKRATNDYELFMNYDGTQEEYLEGAVPEGGFKVTWNQGKSLRGTIQIKFAGGWNST